jgi:predicted aldo/keto reductase-like oxidoreductase
MKSALDHDPEYLEKVKHNIEALKREGLIRFACADTFSGEHTYLRQIEAGCFDAVYINFNFADDGGRRKVLPMAKERRLGVISREAFMKGELFKMGMEVGITDLGRLANIALKWNLSHEAVTTVVVGTNNPDHLARNLQVLEDLELSGKEKEMVENVKKSLQYKAYEEIKRRDFFERKD